MSLIAENLFADRVVLDEGDEGDSCKVIENSQDN